MNGTSVQDYIHVIDLAEGHIAALENLTEGIQIYLGTGKDASVLELEKVFEEANDTKFPYEIVERRSEDIASCNADASKVERELSQTAKRDIVTMCRDSWRFEKNYIESEEMSKIGVQPFSHNIHFFIAIGKQKSKWKLPHLQPLFADCRFYADEENNAVSESFS